MGTLFSFPRSGALQFDQGAGRRGGFQTIRGARPASERLEFGTAPAAAGERSGPGI